MKSLSKFNNALTRAKTLFLTFFFALGAYGIMAPIVCVPVAFGSQWDPQEMMENAGSAGGIDVQPLTAERLAEAVKTFTSYIIAIAVILFVLKVVLTAVDRMVLGNSAESVEFGGGGPNGQNNLTKFRLCDIPLIGAYKPEVAWKRVWIHFATQLAIIAAAWLIVQVIMQVILMLIGFIQG